MCGLIVSFDYVRHRHTTDKYTKIRLINTSHRAAVACNFPSSTRCLVCVCVLVFFHSKPLLRTSQLCTGKRAQTSVICTYAEINECIGFNDRCSAVAFHVSPPSGAFILINGAPESDFMCASRPPSPTCCLFVASRAQCCYL